MSNATTVRRYNHMTTGATKLLRLDGSLATFVLRCDGPGHLFEMNPYNSEQEAAAALASALRRNLACSSCRRIDR